MKFAVVLLGLVACAVAFPREEIDVARLEPRHIWIDAPGPLPEDASPRNSNLNSSRIINGEDAPPGEFGYQAGLIINGQGFCGGSLIRADFILTAAHCVDNAFETQVILGFHVIQGAINTQQVIRTRDHYVHPHWDARVLQNDIALVRIPHVNPENPTIWNIPLAAHQSPSFSGFTATLSGWGRKSDASNSIAPYLQVVDLTILTNTRCRLNFLGQIIKDQHLCTAGSNGHFNVGACNGDSGGPLVVEGIQVGVVSFGVARCEAGWPSVFARVSYFIDFILGTLKNFN